MILVDSNIIIDYIRKPNPATRSVFISEHCAICGIVLAEVVHGARNEADADRIVASFTAFEFIPFPESLWDKVGHLLMRLRLNGVRVPFQDAVMASLCTHLGIKIWTRDKHFKVIQMADHELSLYEIP